MGEVWLGEDETLGRTLAVKAIRQDRRLDDAARARFLREARVLSRLDHPNVCRLYDYVEEDGAGFILLEMVEGTCLADLLDGDLGWRRRLELMVQVAEALGAAHAMSVVHRDLKPENVMVTADGTAKVLDFGLARPVDAVVAPASGNAAPAAAGDAGTVTHQAGRDSVTRIGDIMGTPRYMSPEQARGEPVTAASDMYSFGLLLQEVLTDTPPHDRALDHQRLLRKAVWGERQPIRGGRPSVVSLVDRLTKMDPAERPTAQAAAAELRRIRDAPRRLRRRLAGIAALAVLCAFTAALAVLSVNLRRQADRAAREASVARETTDFLLDLFEAGDPYTTGDPDLSARELVSRGADRIHSSLEDQPGTRARLLVTLGGIDERLGLYEEARDLLGEALGLYGSQLGEKDAEVIPVLRNLASAERRLGHLQRAEELLGRALPLAEQAGTGLEVAEVLHDTMLVLQHQSRLDEAEAAGRRSLSLFERALGVDDPQVGVTAGMLGLVVLDAGRYDEAEPLLERAVQIQERTLPPDHPRLTALQVNLATVRKELGRYREAEKMYRRAIASNERRLGAEHPEVAVVLNDLGVVLLLEGRAEEACQAYRRAVGIAVGALGERHPVTGIFTSNLAEAELESGRAGDAEDLYRRALEIVTGAFGNDHPAVAEVLGGLAATMAAQGRSDEAEERFLAAAEIRRRVQGADHPDLGRLLARIGGFYRAEGRREEADQALRQALDILENALGPDHPTVVSLRDSMGVAH